MSIIKSLKWRYACKKFDSTRKLEENQIDMLKNAFNLTATSYGLQPLKMLVVNNEEVKEKLKPHAYHQPQITTCSHLLILCIDTSFDAGDVDHKFDLEKKIRGTEEKIIEKFRGQLKQIYANKNPEQIERESIYQAYIALGNLMTVCAELRIDSCPMEGFSGPKVDEALELDKLHLKSVLLLPVGYRAQDDPTSGLKKVRKPLEEVIIEIL